MMKLNPRAVFLLMLLALTIAFITPALADKKNKLEIEIREWNLTVSEEEIPAGMVDVTVKNKGKEVHELAFVKLSTNEPVGRLPVDKDGAIDEKNMNFGTIIDEVEGLEPGKKEKKSVRLKPGRYAIICNMLEQESDGTMEAHYSKGMSAELIVK